MNVMSKPPFALYRREGSAKWWVRFTIKGHGQVRKSLETDDESAAHHRAYEVWVEANNRAKQGLATGTRSFEKVAEEFIEHIEREVERGERSMHHKRDMPPVIRRYFIPYFGAKNIDAIGDRDVVRYLEWRKEYWLTGPGKDIKAVEYQRNGKTITRPLSEKRMPSLSRQRGESVILRQLFRQAAKWGYIKNNQLPEVEVERKRVPNNRPSFELDEFRKLVEASLARMADPKIIPHIRRDRTILHAQIMIAAFTGMRPTEMKNLTWGDVIGYRADRQKALKDRDIRLRVQGKAKHRTFIPMEAALTWFDTLWMLWVRDHDADPQDNDPVFATQEGKPLGSVKKGLAELFKHCGLLTDYRGVRPTSYSFRHFYISQQLVNGVDVFALAKNTGTSPQMIDKFYGQVKLERMKDHLRPDWSER